MEGVQDNIVNYIKQNAAAFPQKTAFRFIDAGDASETRLSFEDLHIRIESLASHLQSHSLNGKNVLLIYDDNLEFIISFFACQYIGAVAVPASQMKKNDLTLRILNIIKDSDTKVILSSTDSVKKISRSLTQNHLEHIDIIATDPDYPSPKDPIFPENLNGRISFIQYTSGSTSDPKGVVITHENLIHNQRQIQQAFNCDQNSVIFSWLPFHHDMGLVGNIIHSIYIGCTCILASPYYFFQQPGRWLDAISKFKVTHSGGPNFAYDLCVANMAESDLSKIDLSSWKVAFNGSENVDADTIDRFWKFFRPCGFRKSSFFPCYGLAESTLLVSGIKSLKHPTILRIDKETAFKDGAFIEVIEKGTASSVEIVSCGKIPSDSDVKILSTKSHFECKELQQGEICISGKSVTKGYWNRSDDGSIIEFDGKRYLKTGDIGFFYNTELFIIGRIKEMLIIRGKNYYPYDIEKSLSASISELEPNGVVAFESPYPKDGFIIAAELKRKFLNQTDLDRLVNSIDRSVVSDIGISPSDILILKPHAIPRTTSGKPQRLLCKELYSKKGLASLISKRKKVIDKPAPGTNKELLNSLLLKRDYESIKTYLLHVVTLRSGLSGLELPDDTQFDLNEIGIDSLRMVEVINTINKDLGLDLQAAEVFKNNTLHSLISLIEQKSPTAGNPIYKVATGENYPLSSAQFRIWLLSQSRRGCIAYNIVKGFHIQGSVDLARLEEAFRWVISRHESLRTIIKQSGGEPRQFILDDPSFNIQFNDLSASPQKNEEILKCIDLLYNHYFDLSSGPLIKVGLLKVGEDQSLVLLCVHHIICDGWSLSILTNEVNTAYEDLISNKPVHVSPLTIQYRDYSNWSAKKINDSKERHSTLFRESNILKDYDIVDLPYDRSRQNRKTFNGGMSKFYFGKGQHEAIVAFCKNNDLSVFDLLTGVLVLLIYKLSGQKKIIIGTPVSGRNHFELEDQIGLFINTIPIVSQVNESRSLLSFAKDLNAEKIKGIEFQELPFEEMIRALDFQWDASRNPLFDIMVVLQRTNWENFNGPLNPLTWSSIEKYLFQKGEIEFENISSKMDLTFFFSNDPDGDFFLEIEYSADLFLKKTISKYFDIFLTILSQVIDAPEKPISQLNILTQAERDVLLFQFNQPVKSIKENNILDLLRQSFLNSAHKQAILTDHGAISYAQLDLYSDELAGQLTGWGFEERNPNLIIGLLLGRSEWMIISIIAVLKAGFAYVAIDINYPGSRITDILQDTALNLILTDDDGSSMIPSDYSGKAINVKRAEKLPTRKSPRATEKTTNNEDLAYVIYTSGSSGRPKGVEISHRNAIAFLNWAVSEFKDTPFEIMYATTSYCFDLSVFEFFLPLILGKPIRVLDSALDIPTFLLQDNRILINTVPSAVASLIEQGTHWQNVVALNMAGEAIPANLKEALDHVAIEVRNLYGPSECTTYSTVYRFKAEEHKVIPIGKPIENTQIFILGPGQDLVPVGVIGEVCIGGAGVARGYLNRPDLTADRFIASPFRTGERLYRTGDLGRWLPDGNIEFLGRLDHQVKIRGYRIEPGEIESVLLQSGLVQQAVVICHQESPGNQRLIAYVVPAAGYTQGSALTLLRAKLPEYMVPGLLVKLDALPLTPNGKTDRRALLQIDLSATAQPAYEAPEGPLEMQMAAIWSGLFNARRIGQHDNFFQLGGHSLLAMRLAAAIRTEFQVEVSIATIFNHPTIALLAAFIAAAPEDAPALPALLAGLRPQKIPLSFSQERLWFIDALEGSLQYHLPFVLRLKGELDRLLLEKALTTIVNRHEVLRTVIAVEEGQPYQQILDQDGWQLGVYSEELSLSATIEELIQKPFNLATDHLLRADLIRTAPNEHLLVGTLHHIVADGWSIPILVRELTELYNALVEARPYQLPELPVQYADYALWQRGYLSGEILQRKLAYWQQQLAGAPVLQLPTDHPRSPIRSTKGASEEFRLDSELTGRLETLCLGSGATLYMTLLSVFNILLYKYSGQDDCCVGSPIAVRPLQEVEGLIGFFVNTLVLRSRVSPDMNFRDLLFQVKKTTLEAYAHQDVPFEKIVEAVVAERDLSRNPLFDVLFTLQNNTQLDSLEAALSGLSVSVEEHADPTAKFDLSVTLQQQAGGITGSVTYNSDLYDPGTIQRMITHYQRLLQAVVTDQDQRIGELPMITEAERQDLLFGFNDTGVGYPREKTIVDLFYEQAAKTPDQIAVVFDNQQLTYRQLDQRSNQLGHLLRSRGVREDSLVAISMERSLEMVIAILGILKAGGAYVPIDPGYPEERIVYILEDTAAPIALITGPVRLPATNDLVVINIDTDKVLIDAQERARVNSPLRPDHLAYIIYTSGSTGRPKGVAIAHSNATAFLHWAAEEFKTVSFETMYATTSYCFDLSVFEFFLPLITGKRIRVLNSALDIPTFLLQDDRVMINTVPSAVTGLLEQGIHWKNVVALNMAGEVLPVTLKESLDYDAIEVRNLYGPSECTTYSTVYRFKEEEHDLIPIGKPIANTQIYLLGPGQELVPVGVTGEIVIGGAGVARGYLNRPDLTADRFIESPFRAGERLYRTGDLGRWLPDGNIEFLGRLDHQVKIRGYRIEPGEIESVLVQTGGVQQAVVLCKEDQPGNKRLIGYIVPTDGYTQESVLTELRAKLPGYMVPGLLVELDTLPLTPNGKTDRKALLAIDLSATAQRAYEVPEGSLEGQLATIWSGLLNMQRVGRYDNFFQLGGHSLLAMRLVAAIRRELQVELGIATIFQHPTIAASATFIAAAPKDATLPALITAPRPQKIPLSFSQERLWFIDALEGSLQYHLPFVLRLKGELDSSVLEKSLMTIVNRHEVLRTVIAEEDGQPYQQILDQDGWRLGVYSEELSLSATIEELIRKPFNLSKDYLLRADLIRTAPNEHVLIGTLHHIVADGWSIPILVKELTELYNALVEARPYRLPDLPVQYADYALWQRGYLSGETLQNKLAYWQQQLAEVPVLQLSTDHPRGPVRSTRGAVAGFLLDPELSDQLQTLSLGSGATLYMTLLSVFNILLYKYSGQDDLCVGSPIAGRPLQEVEGLIGFFVNTLALRSRVSPEMNFRDLLLQVKKTALEAYAHQDVPFEKIVEAVVIERDLSRSPLFDVLFTLQNNTQPLEVALSGLSVAFEGNPDHTAQFDLSVTLQEQAGGITGSVTYNSDLYDPGTIQRMITHYQRLLQAVVTNQDQRVSELPMITEAERQDLLFGFNDTGIDYPRDTTIVDLFYEQAAKTPDQIAVVFDNQQLTYRQLDQRSNQLGHYLQQHGVREDSLVVIGMERSLEMIIAILGILKAGGAYVPIDPGYPEERIAYILEDTAAPIALTAGPMQLPETNDLVVIDIGETWIDAQEMERVNSHLRPDHLAYIIYTSGSTGRPKGVEIAHSNATAFLHWAVSEFKDTPFEIMYATTSYCFDLSVFEFFLPLITGKRIRMLRSALDIPTFLFQDDRVLINTVPSAVAGLIEQSIHWKNVVALNMAGEAIPVTLKESLDYDAIEVRNLYGPSECTTYSTVYRFKAEEHPLIPIGKPIANTQIYILDEAQQLAPRGVTGEICIGGAGVVRGYLNRPDLTADRFIESPFYAGERLYRTGDLGRWLPDGNIEFLGRLDHQVKIRGYRIEPGEIESVLLQSGLVQQAVVICHQDSPGNQRLIAYVVPADGYERETTLTSLRTKLPGYMVPGLLVELDTLPLTPNGKTDRKALLAIDLSATAQRAYEAPEGSLEGQLATIWAGLLNIQRVGRHDNFFRLGGHSLLAMRLVAAIRAELGIEPGIATIFHYPTIAALATFIAAISDAVPALPVLLAGPRPQKIPLSFSQERLWFIDALEGSLQYHLPFVLRLKGELDSSVLEKSLMTIVNRHEVLRTVIAEEDGQPYQRILDENGWRLGDAGHFVYTDEPTLAAMIDALIQKPFHLASDYLLRADLIRTAPNEHLLVGTLHHIVADGWSIPILVKELTELYNALIAGRPYRLPDLPVQYADYALWQRGYLCGEVLQNKLDYWQQQLAGVPVLQLPTDHPRGRVRSNKGASLTFLLDKELTEQLDQLSLGSDATLYMTLVSVFNILLYKYSGQGDICIGSPIAGRPLQEIEGLIGFFVNTLALRGRVSPEMNFRDLLLQVKQTTLAAYAHQDVPFEKIVEAVVTERDLSRNPLFDVLFTLQNNTQPLEVALSGLSVAFEGNPDHTAQFDLSVTLQEQAGGITGSVTYNGDLYDPGTIQRMITHYQRLLQAVVTNQDQRVSELPMITEAEREDLLFGFNDTHTDYPREKTIASLFYEQAAKTPDQIALVFDNQELTYRQLDERSNQLGHYLQQHGVREDSLVVIGMERSLEMVIAILGILKAGGAYVPIDPGYPEERIAYILEDTAAPVALVSGGVQLPTDDDLLVIDLGEALINAQSTATVNTQLLPSHLAYIIYTSGSTGRPKGVEITHSNAMAFLHWAGSEFTDTPFETLYATTSYCFDLSVFEFFLPLITGKRIRMLRSALDIPIFLLQDNRVLINTVPSAVASLIEQGTHWKNVVALNMAGEVLPVTLKESLDYDAIEVRNLYGPSECTTYSTVYRFKEEEHDLIPIGKPIANTQIYLLGPGQDLVPVGVTGEICIGGAGVARGYLNRPDLTADRFIESPFRAGERLYRTGDLGRWLPDGNIEFLGRLDHQVKIRGYRIEPGEIESVLVQSGLIQQAVVICHQDSPGNQRLIAYVVPADGYERETTLTSLRTKLPGYMVPGLLVELDTLPLTPNGKTDRKALLAIDLSATAQRAYEAPEGSLEGQLATIWSGLLNIQRVGRHDNFFQLGGHSLLAMRLVAAIRRELQVELGIATIFQHPTIAASATFIAAISDAVPALPVLLTGPRPQKIPLSFSQERLWFIDALEGSLQYHLPFVLRLKGELDSSVLEKSLMTIVNRHEVLRTVIAEEDGQPYQRILDENGWRLGVYSEELSLPATIEELIRKPFNLSKDYLLRADLIRTAPNEHVLIGTLHHIVADGWSIPILVKELTECYNALVEARPYRLPELPVQYADYALWQRGYLSGETLQNKLAYWQQQLAEVPMLQLPTDHARGPIRINKAASAGFRLDDELAGRLEALSLESGATLYMTLLSVFNILLYKYSGQSDLCVGSPIAGRQLQEVEGLIGFFINTLVIRSQVSPEMNFRDLLLQVKKTALEAYAHQDVPFEKIVEAVITERHRSRNPLFDVRFTLHNLPETGNPDLGSAIELIVEPSVPTFTQIDLSLDIYPSSGGITGSITYNSDLYDPGTIQRMITHFQRLLKAAVANQDQPVNKLEMMSEAERQELLFGFNDTGIDYPRDTTIAGLFYEQAAKTPNQIAVVFDNHELSYQELDERSNQLAHLLRSRGVREESLVVIGMERSLEMIVAILGILKAGGAYVPVDPDYPEERIAYILEDTAARVALTAGPVQLPATDDLMVIHLDTDKALIDTQENTRVTTRLRPTHLAYVIYTSGSTGWPKGVMIEHRSLINYLFCSRSIYINGKPDGAGSFVCLSYAFDASITSLFLPLISGKTIVVSSKDWLTMFEEDANLQKYAPYDFIKLTPSHLEFIERAANHSESLSQRIIVGGEALRADHFKHLANRNITIINEYGPTESTVGCTIYSVDLANGISQLPDAIPIGRPIANTQIYILGPGQELVPIGVTGEICIGGAGLARGYLNRRDLTAEKFIPHPFSTDPDACVYRTGDLGRWLPDGNIEFLGRLDDQVKIRGYRIEPGEIESALVQTGQVQQAVVLCKEDLQGNKRLIGYVVPATGYERGITLASLRTKLPEYMIPDGLIELDTLPLTSNGKTDRKALLQMDLSVAAQPGYEAPESALEAQLAAIWSDLLSANRVGRHDDFFQLGGHSLLAMRLIAAIRTELGIELGIATIFNHPTVALLAAFIVAAPDTVPALPAILAGPRPQKIPLSFSQERLWFIDALEGSLPYHLPFVLRLKGKLDAPMLEKALLTIVNRHEVLRTVIAVADGQPYQHILDEDGWQLGDAGHFVYTDEPSLAAMIDALIQKPFHLASDHLLRADLIQTTPTEHVLVGTLHHIVSDGWSIPILVRELTELYNSFVAGRPYQLPDLPVQYADYAIWQRGYLSGEVLQNKLAYWQQQLAEVPVLQLPTDHARGAVRSNKAASARFRLDCELSGQLEKLSLDSGATLYMTLLSVFNILLYKYSGQSDLCVGSPTAGRQMQEVEGLIGFFINTLVIRSRVSPEMPFRDLLLQVKHTTLAAYAHQEVPFEKIVDAVVTERDLSRSPLFDVKFVLHNLPETGKPDLGSTIELTAESSVPVFAQIDLSLDIYSSPDGITGSITYNSDLYDPGTIQRMITHYRHLLQAVIINQDQPVSELPMITEAERQELLFGFNDTRMDYPRDKTIVDLFFAQAAKTPDHIAVVFDNHELTYRQLDQRSNQLGHLLRSRGVREESLVVVCIERSLEMIIAIFGILKAGGAYVPVDPDYPQDRIAYMLEDTAARIALTAGLVQLPEADDLVVINIDTDKALIDAQETTTVTTRLRPSHLAYVIYTSGSTGWPKGVMVEHKSFVNMALSKVSLLKLNEDKIVLQFASLSFDASCWEIFATLVGGSRLIIPPKETLLSVDLITRLIEKNKIDILAISPSYQLQVKGSLHNIKTLLSAGEKLNQNLTKEFQSAGINVVNAYGPTENTVCATFAPNPLLNDTVSIGRPIANVQIYILDNTQRLVPIGITGEICIGGAGLARGYLNRSDLTAEKFIPHPFSADPDARIYRTGDLGRWLPDGNIEFLERRDDQVKIRGFRIEPGEIESALVQSGQVRQAVVLCHQDSRGNQRLIGYVVPAAGYGRESALDHLRTKLPEYMVPGLLIELDILPLTPNGKADRKALLQMDPSAAAQPEYEAPASPLEAQLAAIWSGLLDAERVGRHDNFFQLGGHSLLAMRLVASIKTELDVEISIVTIFESKTIAELSVYLDSLLFQKEHLTESNLESFEL